MPFRDISNAVFDEWQELRYTFRCRKGPKQIQDRLEFRLEVGVLYDVR